MSEVNPDLFKSIKLKEVHLERMNRSDLQRLLVKFNLPARGTNLVLKGRIRTHILPHVNSQSSSTETETPQVVQFISQETQPESFSTRQDNVAMMPTNISLPSVTPSDSAAKRVTPGESAKKTPPEKRLKRFRPNCTNKIHTRIERARSQRLYLIQQDPLVKEDNQHCGGSSCTFHVMGSTGNLYDVIISKIPKCNCPDHQKGNLCKHILFVFIKIIGLDHESNLIYQNALLQSELDHIFLTMEQKQKQRGTCIMAKKAVQNAFNKRKIGLDQDEQDDTTKRKDLSENDECAICFDTMDSQKEALTFCKSTCGTNFHKKCIDLWIVSKVSEQVCCPTCRQPWIDDQNKKNDGSGEGYVNMGRLQGQSRTRDTTTYSSWYTGWKRQRYYR